MKTTLMALFVATALLGCGDGGVQAGVSPETHIGNRWYKTYDQEEGVVCYVYKGIGDTRPANCLPMKQR